VIIGDNALPRAAVIVIDVDEVRNAIRDEPGVVETCGLTRRR